MKPPRETLRPSPKKPAPNCWRGGHWSGSPKAYEARPRHPQMQMSSAWPAPD
jgi:hypothetical protein